MSYKSKANIADELEHKPAEHPPLPCRSCGAMTARATLNTCGALCYPCYASYCRSGPPPRYREGDSPTVADMKTRLRPGHRFDYAERKAA